MTQSFQKMLAFFEARRDKHVVYDVVANENIRIDYYDDIRCGCDCVQNFTLIFPVDKAGRKGYFIDGYDDYVFDMHVIDYGDRIEVTDGCRFVMCAYDSYEGSTFLPKCETLRDEYIQRYGFEYEPGGQIRKVTTEETFVRDVINLIRLLLIFNYVDENPPHIRENDNIKEDIAALEKSWLEE